MNIEESQLPDSGKYGKLLTPDILIHRQYFEEMVELIGIRCIYYAPRSDKKYTTYGEIESNYQKPELIGCLFNDHIDQKSMRKMGWNSELTEDTVFISVPYDLHDIQAGALFAIPSGLDNAKGRLFRVTQLSNTMIYPASITCALVPEWRDTMPETKKDIKIQDFNLLAQEDKNVF